MIITEACLVRFTHSHTDLAWIVFPTNENMLSANIYLHQDVLRRSWNVVALHCGSPALTCQGHHKIIADDLAPNGHQDINNHHADLIVTIM